MLTRSTCRRMRSRRQMSGNRHSCSTCPQGHIPPSCAEPMAAQRWLGRVSPFINSVSSLMVNHGSSRCKTGGSHARLLGSKSTVDERAAWEQSTHPVALQEKITVLTLQLQTVAAPNNQCHHRSGDRDWHRFNNRRQIASYTGLCPGEYSSGNTRCKAARPNTTTRACALPWWNWLAGCPLQPNYKPVLKWRAILAK